jgi:hypothetical protein
MPTKPRACDASAFVHVYAHPEADTLVYEAGALRVLLGRGDTAARHPKFSACAPASSYTQSPVDADLADPGSAESRRLIEQLRLALSGLTRLELLAAEAKIDADELRHYLRVNIRRERDRHARIRQRTKWVSG